MRHLRFREGRNCWRLARARRIGVLVDGEEYFAAVRSALINARRQVLILGWDIHSRIELVRDEPDDGFPTRLSDLLAALLEARPELHIHILLWSYAPVYALEREPSLFGSSPWEGLHPRLAFVKDDGHPLAASHHQKLVVVDGRVAFSGGLDLSKWRWDSCAHLAEDPRRQDHQGKGYPPFHDVQMLVDGPAAEALTELALKRWRRATGETLSPRQDVEGDPWPASVTPLLRDRDCAIARTFPEYRGQSQVREVERLFLDTIATARRFLYFENQYLTSRTLCDALCASLRRRRGPEVVIVLPRETGAWLEQHTMDVLRARAVERLRGEDRHGRLRIYYPTVPGLAEGNLVVHAKVTIADDQVLRVGSANLSNRSLGLDTECDLCVKAADDGDRATIAGLRRRLIGHFLDVGVERLAEAEARESGLIAAVESLRTGGRSLAPLDGAVDPEWERQLPDERLIDPDRPLNGDIIEDVVVGKRHMPTARKRLWIATAVVLALLALAAAWRWTPLGEWLEPTALADALRTALLGTWGPLLLAAGYVIGSLIAIPVTLLILVTALVYGPTLGVAYALVGSLLAALASYWVGRWLGRGTVERFSGDAVQRLNDRLSRRGILTVVAVRVIPVAPFVVINLFAGASRISLRDYLLGTLIGMLPGIAGIAVFAEGILALVRDANLAGFLVALLALVFIIGLMLLARRLLRLRGGGR